MGRGRYPSIVVTLCAVWASGGSAVAQTFDVERFEPSATQSRDYLNVTTSDVLPHVAVGAGLLLHVGDDLLESHDAATGEVESRLIDEQYKGELSLALGLFDQTDLGLTLPMFVQTGQAGAGQESFGGFGFSDLRVTPRARLFRAGGVGLAFAVPFHLPTGDVTRHQSGGLRGEPRVALDWRGSDVGVAMNVGYLIRRPSQLANYVSDDALRWGAAARWAFHERAALTASAFGEWGFFAGRDPADYSQEAPNVHARSAELLAAVDLSLTDKISARLGAGPGIATGVGAPDFRVFAGLDFESGPPDLDADQISGLDRCPTAGEDHDGFEDDDGCPDVDNDRDAISDVEDACPDQPEDRDGFEDGDGCPDPDNDADGTADVDDLCPDTPGDLDRFGCPFKDADGDGVADGADQCAGGIEDEDGFADEDGCPDTDNDADGIEDSADACPNEPESFNGVEDVDGCPESDDQGRARLRGGQIQILEAVYFDTAQATIKPESFAVLDDVAALMLAREDVVKVRIEGHTDSRGAADSNLDLAQRRAESVRAYLTGKGVQAQRLVATGYGEIHPIADNRTPEGRSTNRRVVFVVVEGGPSR